ncbi:MAG: phosphoribosylanthranilate isomerase, partial [Verrucomicrobiales bacterium]
EVGEELGVHALGINFWPSSKRYCPPAVARQFLPDLAGRIARVGVFVNNAFPLAAELHAEGLLDAVQLHGDETSEDIAHFVSRDIPLIRAIPATDDYEETLPEARPDAVILDTPAGKHYGGTGHVFDWDYALRFKNDHPGMPLILAGGIKPKNAARALAEVQPAALDVASGAESAPGVKDLAKVRQLLALLT